MNRMEVTRALSARRLDPDRACEYVAYVLAMFEQLQEETPNWKVWSYGPLTVTVRVIRSAHNVLCPHRALH